MIDTVQVFISIADTVTTDSTTVERLMSEPAEVALAAVIIWIFSLITRQL